MTGGLLVLLVVVVCVATLATHQPNKNRYEVEVLGIVSRSLAQLAHV